MDRLRPPGVLDGMRVAVAGGSVSGSLVARAFEQAGATAHVSERTEADRPPRGGALTIRPEGRQALQDLGIDLGPGYPLTSRYQRFGGFENYPPFFTYAYTWADLNGTMRGHVSEGAIHDGQTVTAVTPSRTESSLSIRGKEDVSADLVVVANGRGSELYQSLAPFDPKPEYAGYVVYRGETKWEDVPRDYARDYDSTLYEHGARWGLFNAFPFYRKGKDGELIKCLTWAYIAQEPPEMVEEVFGPEYAPTGFLPQGKMTKRGRDHLADVTWDSARSNPDIHAVITGSDVVYAHAIHDLPEDRYPERIVFDRTAIVGDAAYTVRPFTAMSTSKAAVDAVSLRDAVTLSTLRGRGVQSGLDDWQYSRLPQIRRIANRTRSLDRQAGLPVY